MALLDSEIEEDVLALDAELAPSPTGSEPASVESQTDAKIPERDSSDPVYNNNVDAEVQLAGSSAEDGSGDPSPLLDGSLSNDDYDDLIDGDSIDDLFTPAPVLGENTTKSEPANTTNIEDDDRRDETQSGDGSGPTVATSGSSEPPSTPEPTDPTAPPDAPIDIVGSTGADNLSGGTGNDTIDGGFGNDVIFGDAGDDRLLGNYGDDQISGGDGNDYAFGAAGADIIDGGAGNDELRGGFHNDTISGGDGDDYLNGWTGNDRLAGGDGNDTMDGGLDHDTYVIDAAAAGDTDLVIDAGGDDVLLFEGLNPFESVATVEQSGNNLIFSYAGGGSLTLQDFYGAGEIEKLHYDGTDYVMNADASSPLTFDEFINGTDDQILTGTSADDVLTGGIGNDQITGLAGHDTLSGDAGEDTISGGDGNDVINGGADDDRILGQLGDDIASGDGGDDYLFGDFGNDTLSGGDGNDEVRGGFNHDVLNGDAGDDFLHGFHGNDVMDGGTGTDRMEGGDGFDTFIMRRGHGSDTISDFTAFGLGAVYADTIDLSDFGIPSFDDLVMSELDGETTIDLGAGDSLTLEGVSSATLGAEDFNF